MKVNNQLGELVECETHKTAKVLEEAQAAPLQ
jgi:hypothetical protein